MCDGEGRGEGREMGWEEGGNVKEGKKRRKRGF
jgi:hypothetical protein